MDNPKEQILQKLLQYIEKSEDFLLEQSPQVIQEMVRFKKISTILDICFFSFILLTCLFVAIWMVSQTKIKDHFVREFLFVFIPIICFAFSPFLLAQIFSSVKDLIELIVAPKSCIIQLIRDIF